MTMFLAPYTAIADIDGSPLDAGFIYFGEYGKDPELFPVEVFWDADFAVPAAQPIRTRNGYPVRNGSPTKVYLKTAQHSIVIKNRNGAFILVDFKNKGWDASFVVSAGGDNQQEINDRGGSYWREKPLGYDINSRVMLENGCIVRSTVAGNTNDPNVDMTGWVYDTAGSYVDSIADLRNTEPLHIGQLVHVLEYSVGTGYGGGLYKAVESNYTGSDSEETLGGSRWRMVTERHVFPIDRLGAVKDNPVTVRNAFIRAIECVREAGDGTVYVGAGEWTMAGVLYEVNTSNITFHFDLGCHFKMRDTLLGWYPTAIGKGYSNVAIVGRGTIETQPGGMWHNDLVYVDGVEVRDLTFIRPVMAGHFLDLIGCTNITVDGITVKGSNVERPVDPRLFSEFIQVGGDNADGLGWPAMRTKYASLINQGIGTSNVTLTNSVFIPYTDSDNITTYPPRPIGNHGATPDARNIRIVGNKFKDVIRQATSARAACLEMPTVDGVHISGNSFIHTSTSGVEAGGTFIALRGDVSSGGVDILNNTFDITRPDGLYMMGIQNHVRGSVVNVTGNTFKCAAGFSDIISLDAPSNIRVLGNSVHSTGRRLLHVPASGAGSVCLVQGNNLVFNPAAEASYRDPVEVNGSSLNIAGNHIQHPSRAFRAQSGSVCTATGNTMVGGAVAVAIAKGVLTGNVFNTATAPVVTIDGTAQTSRGWDFVHVPA